MDPVFYKIYKKLGVFSRYGYTEIRKNRDPCVEILSRYGKAATKKDAKSQSAAAAYLNLCPHIAPQVDTSIAAVEVVNLIFVPCQ